MTKQESHSQLLIISGKGGVGKTTITAALGMALCSMGKKVLMVGVRGEEKITEILQTEPVGYHEKMIFPDLYAISIKGEDTVREYLKIRLRVKRAFETILNNPLYRYLVEAIPGLMDLFSLGKVWDIHHFGNEREKRWFYDYIILDSPPSGQGIPFLKVPQTVISALRLGPVVIEAKKIQALLSDQGKTQLIIVTIPEEMAVTEAIERWEKARDELSIKLGPIIINQTSPELFTPSETEWILHSPDPPPALAGLISVARTRIMRRENQRLEIHRLQEKLPVARCIEIPFVPLPHLHKDNLYDMGKMLVPHFLTLPEPSCSEK